MDFASWYETYERDGGELLLFNTIDLKAAFQAGAALGGNMEEPVCLDNRSDRQKVIDLNKRIAELEAELRKFCNAADIIRQQTAEPLLKRIEELETEVETARQTAREWIAACNTAELGIANIRKESYEECMKLKKEIIWLTEELRIWSN